MANEYTRKVPSDRLDVDPPLTKKRITTGCQYCAVGCGYNALLVPEGLTGNADEWDGVSRFITPAMTNVIRYRGVRYQAAVAPDVRCDLNKGNHSVRGGSQGHNMVNALGSGRSTHDRLKSPMVRLSDGRLHEISWETLNRVMAELICRATDISTRDGKLQVTHPERLGVKLFEYQYLENTYAATKLFYSALGTPNVAYHDRPSAAGSSPALKDVGFRPHDFSYEDIRQADVLLFIGTNPYENHSVFFMQNCQGKEIIVLDPRRTATAQYAIKTGGLHLQPKTLGADSLVLYAIARAILEREPNITNEWTQQSGAAGWKVGADYDIAHLPVNKPHEKRRKSRVSSLECFKTFLGIGLPDSESGDCTSPLPDATYTLANAAQVSGIDAQDLHDAVERVIAKRDFHIGAVGGGEGNKARRPRVAILYEKGLIWGFNYHNIAAVGSLGLVLGSYSEPGRLVGRVGGHQKGWAASKCDLSVVFSGSTSAETYPFRNAGDTYRDARLDERIKIHHNIDVHVFGPPPELEPQQIAGEDGRVLLKNGVATAGEPDVRLLWIIGGNYLGQTNDAQRKRAVLERRLRVGGRAGGVRRPRRPNASDIIAALGARIDAGGLVVVHQELFANPTTELCDLIIPAAGWGEDTFCRYNAERRLKLYDRFQDIPLHDRDRRTLEEYADRDPLKPIRWRGGRALRIDQLRHSPKPDWMIIRDIARAIGWVKDGHTKQPAELGPFGHALRRAFAWVNSSDVADEMAAHSHRGLAGANKKDGTSMLGDLLLYAQSRNEIDEKDGYIHRVLGKKIGKEESDAIAPFLTGEIERNRPYYFVQSDNKTFGSGIASNGVMLPVRGTDLSGEDVVELNRTRRASMIKRIRGTLRVARKPPFFFVIAPWNDIEQSFNRINHKSGHSDEVFVTNGRFNHLWNNLFHHLRNDYVNERYPEDLPGTVLEINPVWAGKRRIENGQVLHIGSGSARFTAIASLQESVPDGGAFALFSYPVRAQGRFTFEGYVNNVTDGYCDGIHPIAALKYGRGVIHKAKNPNDGSDRWVFPEHFPHRVPRLGPTFAARNIIRDPSAPEPRTPVDRLNWQMRELIVQKGLPRAFLRRAFKAEGMFHGRFWNDFEDEKFACFLAHQVTAEPVRDVLVKVLLDSSTASMPKGMLTPSDFASGQFPPGELVRLQQTKTLIHGLKGDGSKQEKGLWFAELKVLLNALLDVPHRVVRSYFLSPDSFIDLLRTNTAVRQRLQERLNPDNDRTMIWRDENDRVIDSWSGAEIELALDWIRYVESQSGQVSNGHIDSGDDDMNGQITDPIAAMNSMIALLKSKRGMGKIMHSGIDADGETLSRRFEDEEYDQILQFLRTGKSVRPPHAGDDLVNPEKPTTSAFYLQAKDGVMKDQFNASELTTILNWIQSLTQGDTE